jgi:hypothetical protein
VPLTIPAERWYKALRLRRSRRRFLPRPLGPDEHTRLEVLCRDFSPFPGARAVVVNASPEEVFKGFLGHYGKIKGAPAFTVFIGQPGDPHTQEKVGFLGEAVVLEATSLGLGTCWVAGFFRPDAAASLAGAAPDERVLAVTPVGCVAEEWSFEEKAMAGFGRSHRRKPLSDLVTGPPEKEWPIWIRAALEAARLAPSAVNRQPWRFLVREESITLSTDDLNDSYGISKRLDCGIAMLHIEVACRVHGIAGGWRFLDPPGVATWQIEQSDAIPEADVIERGISPIRGNAWPALRRRT